MHAPNAILFAFAATGIYLASATVAQAQSTPHVLRVPVAGVHASAPTTPPPPQYTTEQREKAWTKFYRDHGLTVPANWATGPNIRNVTISAVPSAPYPSSVVGRLGFNATGNLTNLDGLSSVTSVTGGVSIFSNAKLNDISGLSHITSFGGQLSMWRDPMLGDLSPLSHVESIAGPIYFDADIRSHPGFKPITGGALCAASNASKFSRSMASQATVCASVH